MINKYSSQSLGVNKIIIINSKMINRIKLNHRLLGVIRVSKKKMIIKHKIIIQVGAIKIVNKKVGKIKTIIKMNPSLIDNRMIELIIITIETINKIIKETLIEIIVVITIETNLTTIEIIIIIKIKIETIITITMKEDKGIMKEDNIITITTTKEDNKITIETIINETIVNRITIINHGTIKNLIMMTRILNKTITIKSLFKTHGRKTTIMKTNNPNN